MREHPTPPAAPLQGHQLSRRRSKVIIIRAACSPRELGPLPPLGPQSGRARLLGALNAPGGAITGAAQTGRCGEAGANGVSGTTLTACGAGLLDR
jgi:hypothetical protein